MRALERWNHYWFGAAPYFDLAVVRIVLVGLQLYILLAATYAGLHGVVALPDEMFSPLPALKTLMWPWGWGVRPEEAMVFAVYWTSLAAGVLALFGLMTNASLLVFALGCVYTQAYIFSFGNFHHPQAVMMVALLALALAPSGRVLSLDHWIVGRLSSRPSSTASGINLYGPYAGWPLRLMQWFMALMYLSALSSKLTTAGFEWANGYTLQYYLIEDGLRWDSPLALWVAQHHYLVLIAQWGVLWFQATFVLALLFPKLRWIYLPAGLCIHLGIYLTLNAPFPQWIAMYAVFIPWSEVVRRLAGTRAVSRQPGWQT